MNETKETNLSRKELEQQIISKAESDKEFKNALMDNPKGVLAGIGVQISEDIEVRVVEESPTVVYLVLPVHPEELTDEKMDAISGGGLWKHKCYGGFSWPWCTVYY